MTHKLKTLGLALMAISAFAAVVASSSSAAAFRSEVEPTIITGTTEGNQNFNVGGAILTCTHGTFKGTASLSSQTSVTVFPTYTDCGDNLGHAHGTVPVDTTGCAYVFNAATNAEGHIKVEIECTPGKKIIITDTSCTISVPAQVATEGASVTNVGVGAGRIITVHATAKVNIEKGPEGGCLFLGNTGTYTGTAEVKGYVDNGVHGEIDEANGHTTVYTEGAQVGVWWEA